MRELNPGVKSDVLPSVSIIIPAKNGAPRFSRVLEAVFAQQTSRSFEVIVIDSGSTDETLEIARQHAVRLYEIPPGEFSHSRTRNYGASLSRASQYLIFLNQDAVPSDVFWLEDLVRSIEWVPELKAVCATELVEDKTYYNVSGVASYVFRNSHTKGVHVIAPNILEQMLDLSPWQQRELFPFTTVCAIFDKQHFMKYPFEEEISWGEDLHWAVKNSNKGYASGCSSLSCVYHHHRYTEAELVEIRTHTVLLCRELFGLRLDSDELYSGQKDDSMVDPRLRAVYDSMSWKITAPLRSMHALLLKFLGRSGSQP